MPQQMDVKRLAAEVAVHRHGRVPRELRRRQLLAEAHDLFVERGFAAASMDELARRMGVSKPVVYALAGSKEQLFRDVMARVHSELAERLAAAAAAEPDLPRKLHAGILAFLGFARRRRHGWAALLSLEAGPPGADMEALRRGQAQVVARLLAEHVGNGARRVDPRSLEVLALAITAAVETAALWWQAHPDLSAEALAELLAGLLGPGLLAVLEGRDTRGARPSAGAGRRRGR